MYLLKIAFRPWKISILNQILSCVYIGFLLFIFGFLFWIHHGLNQLLTHFQKEQLTFVYLDSHLDPTEEHMILEKIQKTVSDPHKVEFLDATKFLHLLKSKYLDLTKEIQKLGAEAQEIIPKMITLNGKLSPETIKLLKSFHGVERVDVTKNHYFDISRFFLNIKYLLEFLILGILFSLFMGFVQLFRMNLSCYRESLELLKLWGAKGITLAFPGILGNLLAGVIGGGMAWCSWIGFEWTLTHRIQTGKSFSIFFNSLFPASAGSFFWMPSLSPHVLSPVSIALFLIGLLLSILSGVLTHYMIYWEHSSGSGKP